MNMERIFIKSKEVKYTSLEVDGVCSWDYPEFCDAYVSYGEFINGKELTQEELEILEAEYSDLAYELAVEAYTNGYATR